MMDVETLGPAPDLSAVDFTKMDFGNDPDAPSAEAPPPDDKKEDIFEEDEKSKAEETSAEETPAEEPPKEEVKADEPPRDEQGKFTKKEKSDTRVPKSRFDEAVAKEREAKEAAEKRAEELERQLTSRQQQAQQMVQRSDKIKEMEGQVDTLTTQHSKLMMDGELEKAGEMMKTIRLAERQIARLEAQEEAHQIASQTIEEDRVNLTIARLESDHPVLNPKSEKFDSDIVETVLLWQGKYIDSGMPRSAALAMASEKVLKNFYRTAENNASQVEEKKEGLGATAKADRTKQAVEKSVAASKAQPPGLQNLGLDSDKAGEKGLPDITKMSSDEFNALPETMKAKLRGDLV